MTREEKRMVTITVRLPLEAYRALQRAANEHRVPTTAMASHQLQKANEEPIRVRRLHNVRARVKELWDRGLSSRRIAEEIGISQRSVDDHKAAIRAEWKRWESA